MSHSKFTKFNKPLRLMTVVAMLFGMFAPLAQTTTATYASGGSYSLTWTAADPQRNNGSLAPTYSKVTPGMQACPTPSGSTGRAVDPMANAVYGEPRDSVTSLAPKDMGLGQIVPFELRIAVTGGTSPENGTIQITPYFDTMSTNSSDIGYDPSYGVYCAFVDTKDTASADPGQNAKVDKFGYSIVNGGAANEQIQGKIQVSGLNQGDSVIVEIWVVLKNRIASSSQGNVQTGLLDAKTVATTPENIQGGNQTVPLLRVQEFFSSKADLSVTKTDNADPVTRGSVFSYSIVVTNNSTDTVANGVKITDTLDPKTSFVDAAGATCSVSSGTVTCDVGFLSPGASTTIVMNVKVANDAPTGGTTQTGTCTGSTASIDLCNRVSVSEITTDPNTANNSASQPTDVVIIQYAPDAKDDTATTNEEAAVTINVLANDTDENNNLAPNTARVVTSPTNGTVVKNTDNTFTYTPNTNFAGTDTFKYEVCDATNLCDTATVTITVNQVNDKPVAVNDSASTNEDSAQTIAVLANDSDVEGDTLTVSGVTQPTNGEVVINANGTVTYTPNANFNGTDTFTYTISDGKGGTDTATVSITVNAVNDAPKAANDAYETNEDTKLTVNAPGVLANDSDVDGDTLSVTSYSQADHGTVVFYPNGTFEYTPAENYNGPDSFTYTISDGKGGQDTATIAITVKPLNDLPVAVTDSANAEEDKPVTITVLANDSDVDGDKLSVTEVTQPAHGAVVINADGTLTYTPAANYNGQDSFTYTISDGKGGTATATVTLDVATVADVPVANDDSGTIAEDGAAKIAVLSNDSDVDGDINPATLSIAVQPANGTATVNADATITYTPNANFNGTDTFTYQVCDATNLCDTATVTFTVTPVNDAPVAVNDTLSINEDGTLTVAAPGVLENDSDIDNDTLTVSANTQPANGTLTVNADGSLSYKPNANYNGQDSFTYTVSDGKGGTATATVTLSVVSVNDAPAAANDTYSTDEDAELEIAAAGVLANDSDIDRDTLTVDSFTQPENGSVTVNANGSFSYTPKANYNGSDSFTYTVSDGNGGTATATVSITVKAVNDAPVAQPDNTSTNEDADLTINVLANDSDVDGDRLTVSIVSQPENGEATVNADGTISYEPNANYHGTDSFVYKVCDAAGLCAEARVTVVVQPVNDAPVATNDSYITNEDTTLTVSTKEGVLENDSDVDGDTLTVSVLNAPAHGTLTLNRDGSLSYVPNANYNGADSFTYTVSDGKGGTATATVSITVNSVNDAPVAAADSATTAEDEATKIAVLGNDKDVDGDALKVTTVTDPKNGSVVINPDGTVTYTPNANFNGTDSFSYTVSDTSGATDTATVTITVNAVNDAPEALDDSATTDEDTAVKIDVLDNDKDIDDDTLTITAVTQGAHGAVVINADGTLTYTPAENYNGGDSFTYTISDGNGETSTATVTVGVATANDAPVADDDEATTAEDAATTITVLENDSDVDGDTLTVSIVSDATNGTAKVNADGTVTYTPAKDSNGSDSFTYQVCDNGTPNLCDTAVVRLTVTPVNDAPVAAADAPKTDEDTPVIIDVLANDTDVDGDKLSVTDFSQPSHGTLTQNTDGTFSYTPNTNYNGPDSFTYTISDGNGATSTATVSITVTPVNDAPVANDAEATTQEDKPVTITVLANDTDVDGDKLSVQVTQQPSNGTVTVNADGTVTYTPNANYNGTDSFEYQACDNGQPKLCDTATVVVTVTPVNDKPVAVDDRYVASEDATLTVVAPGVLTNDSDVDGDTLTVSGVTKQPANGTLTLNTDGSFSYTPKANYHGSDSFTYTISDGNGETSEATVVITVAPVNDAPVAKDDAYSTTEGATLNVGNGSSVLGNDSDIDGDTLTVSDYTQPANGSVTVNPDGSFSYTPKADYSGQDSFTYTISDGNGGTATAKVTLTVGDVKPSITVTKTANPGAVQFSGGAVTYTVVVKNTSAEPVTLSSLVDDKFGDLNKTATAKSWTNSTCVTGQTIDKGETYTCTFTANVSGSVTVFKGGSHVNTVTGTAKDNENNSVSASGNATVQLLWRGRTPGYWKNHAGAGQWPTFSVNGVAVAPSTPVTKVFAVPSSLLTNGILDLNKDGKADTLLDALGYKGGTDLSGSAQILLRAGVAGLLNEQQFGAAYPAYNSVSALITAVNGALAGSREAMIDLGKQIDYWNNGVH